MKVLLSTSSLNFQSRNNPLKPFIIKTRLGDLACSEIPSKDLCQSQKLYELSHFFCKNFASLTEDPYWLKYNNPNYKNIFASSFFNYLNNKIANDDGNLTMIVAKNKKGKVQAACLSYTYDLLPEGYNTVCYVDSLAVNDEYRRNGIAKTLLDKTEEINKNIFTDIFLTGEVLARKFYEKIGYSKLDEKDPAQRFYINYLNNERGAEMKYLIPFNKPLQKDKPRWFSIFG